MSQKVITVSIPGLGSGTIVINKKITTSFIYFQSHVNAKKCYSYCSKKEFVLNRVKDLANITEMCFTAKPDQVKVIQYDSGTRFPAYFYIMQGDDIAYLFGVKHTIPIDKDKLYPMPHYQTGGKRLAIGTFLYISMVTFPD